MVTRLVALPRKLAGEGEVKIDESVHITVYGRAPKPPKAKITRVYGVYRGRVYKLYPEGERMTVRYGEKFDIEVYVRNEGEVLGDFWVELREEFTMKLVKKGEARISPGAEGLIPLRGITMPEKKEWRLVVIAGHYE